MGLRDKAMLADLSIGQWGAHLSDKDATRVATSHHGADDKAGNFSKKLFKPGALATIGSIVSKTRTFHLQVTLPWSNSGLRLLKSVDFMEYTATIRKYRNELEEAVDNFVKNYDFHKEQAKRFLGTMYKEENYPTPAKVRNKFYMDIEIMPIPDEKDFRVGADEQERQELVEQIQRQEKDNTAKAVKECWLRLAEVVQPFHERLETEDPNFRKGVVEKVATVAASLKKWQDLTDDPQLADVIQSVENNLAGYDEDTLNVNVFVRDDARAQTKEIMDTMSGYL